MNARGYTLVESVVVLLIVGILVRLAIPPINAAKRQAVAAHVIGDFTTIRLAAFDVHAATGSWPSTGGTGRIPAGMANSLPRRFRFSYRNVTYRWRSWALPNGLPSNPGQPALLGLEVSTSDRALMASIKGLYRGSVAFGTSTRLTLVVQ